MDAELSSKNQYYVVKGQSKIIGDIKFVVYETQDTNRVTFNFNIKESEIYLDREQLRDLITDLNNLEQAYHKLTN